jgi:hypothetical protein
MTTPAFFVELLAERKTDWLIGVESGSGIILTLVLFQSH